MVGVAKKSRKFKLNKQNIESRAPKSTFNTKRRRSTTTDWTLTLKWHPERTEQMAAEVKVFFGIFWTFPVSSTRDYNWTTLLETTLVYNERTLLWYGSTFALKIVTLRTINLFQWHSLPRRYTNAFIKVHLSKQSSWSMNCSSWP